MGKLPNVALYYNQPSYGLPWSGKSQGKLDFIRVREKSRSFVSGQRVSKFLFKVSEKSGNFILRLLQIIYRCFCTDRQVCFVCRTLKVLKWYYDENGIFPIEAILIHKQVVCMRRNMQYTYFKYLFSFQRYSSFYNMQISQMMTSYTQPNFDQI